MKYYTGVGSRETPEPILKLMYQIAEKLGNEGWCVRSGGADGADSAFLQGAMSAFDKVWDNPEFGGSEYDFAEIYLPWKGFNDSDSTLYHDTLPPDIVKQAVEIAKATHPNWAACGQGARKLHARNVYQVLGRDLKTPSSFLVCWTKDGVAAGGTRTAIVLAEQNNIPVWNLGDIKIEQTVRMLLNEDNLGKVLEMS